MTLFQTSVYLSCICALLSCSTFESLKQDTVIESFKVNVSEFGAGGNDEKDDTKAFQKAFAFALTKNTSLEITIPPGKYFIRDMVYKGIVSHDISVIGNGDVKIICESKFIDIKANGQKKTLNKKSKRGDFSLSFHPNSNNEEYSIMALYSNKAAEDGWNYIKSDCHNIASESENILTLNSPLNFPYSPFDEDVKVHLYKQVHVKIENLKFEFIRSEKWDNTGIGIEGCSIELIKLSFIEKTHSKDGHFVGLRNCLPVNLKTISFEGIMYGAVFQNCRNVFAINTNVKSCIHPYAPALWSTNLQFENIKGTDSTIDSHPCFNVSYNNVEMSSIEGYFNCRALGVKLTNCKFISAASEQSKTIGIGMVTLKKEFEYLYYEYDIYLENITWVHTPLEYNGLHVNRTRTFTVDNCKSHKVSTGGFCNSIVIQNSRIGQFKCYKGNFIIKNTIFDGLMFGNRKPGYALTQVFEGEGYIDNCRFINYEEKSSFLIDFLLSPRYSKLNFSNCEIGPMNGLVKKFQYPQYKYTGLTFKNTSTAKIKNVQRNILENTIIK